MSVIEIIEGIIGLFLLLTIGAILGIWIYKLIEKKDKDKDHEIK